MFAKLFGPPDDQVLVLLDTNDDGDPAITLMFEPKNYGICKLTLGFKGEDNTEDDAYEKAETAFNEMDEARAREMVSPTVKLLGDCADDTEVEQG